jgi:hypothetical protein
MDLGSYLAKFLLGGGLVCLFALIGEICQPKRFAGIFSGAPSVLLAGLGVTLLSQNKMIAILTAEGAMAGAFGMIAYCLVAAPAIRHLKAFPGSVVSLLLWSGIALGAYALLAQVVGW